MAGTRAGKSTMDSIGITIEKVTARNFDSFFGLMVELARFENLAPPSPTARGRLRKDCLGKKPKVEAII